MIDFQNQKYLSERRRLNDLPNQVEHYIEVSVDHTLAFEWTNLYLSCENCNGKLSHKIIPVTEALNPCVDSDKEISSNMTYDGEYAVSVAVSVKGLKTINKFKLNEPVQALRRSKWLRLIAEEVIAIQKAMDKEERHAPAEAEKERFRRYMQPDQPYTLMSTIYLKRVASNLL